MEFDFNKRKASKHFAAAGDVLMIDNVPHFVIYDSDANKTGLVNLTTGRVIKNDDQTVGELLANFTCTVTYIDHIKMVGLITEHEVI